MPDMRHGTSVEQDARFEDNKKKLMKTTKFAEILNKKVDMNKVNLDSLKPWITEQVITYMGDEDDIVVDFICNQLDTQFPNPKELQISLTGFLNDQNSSAFMAEFWNLLLSAMENKAGPSIKNNKITPETSDYSTTESVKNVSENIDRIYEQMIFGEYLDTLEICLYKKM